jgi:hypothetical protein
VHEDNGLAAIELLPDRIVTRIAEILVAIARLQPDAVGMHLIEGVFRLFQRTVGVEHVERRKQAEAALVIAHDLRAVIGAGAAHFAGRGGIEAPETLADRGQ